MKDISFFTDPSITYLMTDNLTIEDKNIYLQTLEDIKEKDDIYNSLMLLKYGNEKYTPNPIKILSALYHLTTRAVRRTYKIARKLIENTTNK